MSAGADAGPAMPQFSVGAQPLRPGEPAVAMSFVALGRLASMTPSPMRRRRSERDLAAPERPAVLDSARASARACAMTSERKAPALCRSMVDVRHGVDRVDEEILALLGERFAYMDAAARTKPDRAAVRDEGRKAQVLANVARLAGRLGVPAAVATSLYETLIEASIAFEFERFDDKQNGQ